MYAETHEDATMEMSHEALEQAIAARDAQSRQARVEADSVEGLAKVLEATIKDYLKRNPDTSGEQIGAALKLVSERGVKE